jgi:hypothetical protein
MFELLVFVGAGIGGFVIAKDFVRTRLRFVDGIRHPFVPLLAGVGAALVTWPLALLPLVSAGTAAIFGLGAGLGTRRGVQLLTSGEPRPPR